MVKTKIIIVDDHAMIREGLKKLLDMENDLYVIATVGSGQEGIDAAIKLRPDVILMDISMPGISGIDAAKTIRKELPQSRIIFLTIHDDRAYVNEALKMHPNGYVLKDADSTVLTDAIRTVSKGGKYTYSKVNECEDSEQLGELSARELQVLGLLAQGFSNKEISQKLLISEKTVKNHLYNIFKKLGVQGRTQAALYAIRNNLC
jgi:DNA-binding NarL/FixJ family response regulator